MPGFQTEDIEASLRMLEVAETEAILVFNGRNKSVLETLGVCLQHLKPLGDRRESISAEGKTSKDEDDPKPKIKQEPQQEERRDLEEIQKLLLDDSIFETSEEEDNNIEEDFHDQLMRDQDFSDSEDESDELPIKSGEGKEAFEDDFDLDDISDEEEEDRDQNANKSFELSDDDADSLTSRMVPTDSLPKQSYQEDKMKEVKALLKKKDKVWTCKSCDYSNKKRFLVTMHAEKHVKGLMFPCKYCPKVYSVRSTLRGHTHKKHRDEGKLRASIVENKKKQKENDLDKEIDEKVGMLIEKDGKLWKCKQCDKIVTKREYIKKHCEIHLTGYSHPCQFCGHKTTNRVAMKQHVRDKHHGK